MIIEIEIFMILQILLSGAAVFYLRKISKKGGLK